MAIKSESAPASSSAPIGVVPSATPVPAAGSQPHTVVSVVIAPPVPKKHTTATGGGGVGGAQGLMGPARYLPDLPEDDDDEPDEGMCLFL